MNDSVKQELQAIIASLGPDDLTFIRALGEDELIRLHRTLGLKLRNGFRSGAYPDLFIHCNALETAETRSYDALSSTALRLIWSALRDGSQ